MKYRLPAILVLFFTSLALRSPAINTSDKSYLHISIEKIERIKVAVHPNAISDQLLITVSDHPEKASFHVFDLNGNVVYSIKNLPASRFTVDCRNFLPGIYLYQVKYEDRLVFSGRFVKHRTLLAA